jgi:NTE family protein
LKGRRYIDGGMRSPTNADMAIGHELVVIIALRLGAALDGPNRMGQMLDQEIDSLKDGGTTAVLITPDDASIEAFGANLMDFSRRAPAARSGLAQGLAYAKDLAPYWT